ncbi:AAA family ATPase [Longispora sp. NPDC051575]|uniref:AAA family ATPase n=1 Tax=Longispora sp. NPDC051575 TaxID=3154943 RepID=UPI00342B999D
MTALPMAGRSEELAAILGAWKQVGDQSQIVVVTGEAGVGKSRLVAEALAALRPRPTRVLAGQARSHAPSPYDWTASALSGHPLGDLPVPPEALAWLTQRPDAPPREFTPDLLLRVAVDVTRAVLGDGPGVLVVEDLHDLDPASLALVAELATTPLPALVLVTSRAPDALAGRVLARLGGTPRTVRRHLGPLVQDEVAEVLEAAFGTAATTGTAPATLAAAVHHRTGGNPYWLTELIAAFRSAGPEALGGSPLPAHLASMVTDRLAGEAPETVRFAHAAALLGGAAALATAEATDAAVHRLVGLGLLVLGADGEPGFRYPLLREAVADSVLPAERAALLSRETDRPEAHLTGREREVLGCVAAGMTNQQAATALGISIRTVTVHVSNLLRKTGSASRTEAALWAVRNGYTE